MKKTNLLLVIGLSFIIGGSALNITANFNNDEIKETKPKRANENLTYFEMTLQQNVNPLHTIQNNNDGTLYQNYKQEYRGYNQALNANLELVAQTYNETIYDEETQTTYTIPLITRNPTPQTTTLLKYQITPYKSLYESKTEQKITTSISLNGTSEEEIKLKFKITSYTSTQDWSTYINQTNWNTPENNAAIIDEITNPQNEQLYNEETQIIEITLTTIKYKVIEIQTNMQIVDNKTTYHFIYIQPYLESEGSTYHKIRTENGLTGYIDSNLPPKISGYIIPNVDNYEVIDLPGLLFNILTMPFAFISTAFNITLFPGTPFQINLSNLFLTIMAILIFVFIVKLFINMKG